jgi:hypothetical protein
MQAKPEFRNSERLGHKYIIKLEDDLMLSPYYAVSYNLSGAGMYFKSLFELNPGAHILIRIDNYSLDEDPVPARVVWCRKLEDTAIFRYGVGVEFLQSAKNSGIEASFPITPHMKPPDTKEGGVVVRMRKRLPQ